MSQKDILTRPRHQQWCLNWNICFVKLPIKTLSSSHCGNFLYWKTMNTRANLRFKTWIWLCVFVFVPRQNKYQYMTVIISKNIDCRDHQEPPCRLWIDFEWFSSARTSNRLCCCCGATKNRSKLKDNLYGGSLLDIRKELNAVGWHS